MYYSTATVPRGEAWRTWQHHPGDAECKHWRRRCVDVRQVQTERRVHAQQRQRQLQRQEGKERRQEIRSQRRLWTGRQHAGGRNYETKVSAVTASNSCSFWVQHRTLCVCGGDMDTMLSLTTRFVLVSSRWKQVRSNCNFNTVCEMVSVRGRLLFFGNLT